MLIAESLHGETKVSGIVILITDVAKGRTKGIYLIMVTKCGIKRLLKTPEGGEDAGSAGRTHRIMAHVVRTYFITVIQYFLPLIPILLH